MFFQCFQNFVFSVILATRGSTWSVWLQLELSFRGHTASLSSWEVTLSFWSLSERIPPSVAFAFVLE